MIIIIIIMVNHDQSSFHQEVKECPGKNNIPAPTYKTYQALQVFPGHLVPAMTPMINCKSSEGAQSVWTNQNVNPIKWKTSKVDLFLDRVILEPRLSLICRNYIIVVTSRGPLCIPLAAYHNAHMDEIWKYISYFWFSTSRSKISSLPFSILDLSQHQRQT